MPLSGITAVCKETLSFRRQIEMVRSCFCLCLNSTLDFPSLCFPFCIWLSACCLCSPNVCSCAPVAPRSHRLVAEPLLVSAWPQQPHKEWDWARIPFPEQGVLQGLCWQGTNRATETRTSLWAVSSAPPEPIPVKPGDWTGTGSGWQWSGGWFPSPGEQTWGLLEFIAPVVSLTAVTASTWCHCHAFCGKDRMAVPPADTGKPWYHLHAVPVCDFFLPASEVHWLIILDALVFLLVFNEMKKGENTSGNLKCNRFYCILSLTLDLCGLELFLFLFYKKASQFCSFWQLSLLFHRSFSHEQDQITFPVFTSVSKENRMWEHL